MTACGNLTIYPVVNFDAYPLSGDTPLYVQFSNKTIGVDNLTYKWDYYNDGVVDSTSENPSASFTNTTSYPITYSVKLTAINTNNVPVSIVKENYITVNPVQDKITVTSPSSGETWQRGTKHTVKWSYTGNLGSYVRLSLLKAGVEIGVIVESTPIGTGSYTWDIYAASTNVGNNFSVKIRSVSKPTVSGTSAIFTLTSPPPPTVVNKIVVTSPSSGETWQRGVPHVITWSYTGTIGTTVKIDLIRAGALIGTITSSAPRGSGGAGSYTWTPIGGSVVGSDFKIRISSGAVSGESAVFALTPAVVNKITVTSPVYGAVWKRSTTHAINWTYTGSVGSTVSIYLMQSGKTSYIQLIGTKAVSSKTISWKIPSGRTPAKNYYIRVVSNTGIKADSPIFTIS